MPTMPRTAFGGTAIAVSALMLAGCAEVAPSGTPGIDLADGLQIVATTTQVADFARELTAGLDAAGLRVTVTSLLEPGESAHAFEPTAADLLALGRADVVLQSGLGLEPWLDDVVAASGFAGERVDATAGLDPDQLEVADAAATTAPPDAHESADASSVHAHDDADSIHAHDDDSAHEHGDGPNPHVWMSTRGAAFMVSSIAAGLERAAPAQAATIAADETAYLARLDELTGWIAANIERVPAERRTLVTNHDALASYAEEFGIEVIGTIIPSWDDAAEPSAAELDAIIAGMRAHAATVIVCEQQLSPATAETIGAQTGARVIAGDDALYTEALGPAGSDGASYLAAQAHNTRVLLDAWAVTPTPLPDAVLA